MSFSYLSPEEFKPYPGLPPDSTDPVLPHLIQHLAVKPLWARHYRCKPSWELPERKLPNAYFTYLLQGRGKVRLAEDIYSVTAGDLIFFPEGTVHSFTHPDGESLEMINMHFHAQVFGLIDFLSLQGLRGVFRDPGGLSRPMVEELARISALRPPGADELMAQLTKSILLYARYHFPAQNNHNSGDFRKLMKIYPALELIRQRLDDPELTADDLAKKLHISAIYLRKLFQEQFSESPVRFINHRRIEQATILLRETDLSVKAVAAQVGFSDLQFFYRIFKRTTGTTPASYRHASEP